MANKNGVPAKINVWRMIRDVLIASMNKGVFPVALISGITALIIIKIPDKSIAVLVNRIIDNLINLKLAAYFLLVVVFIAWRVHTKVQRKTFTGEIDRLAKERTALQKQLSNKKIKSSNKK